MSLPRYPKYKDSGVEWLGEVPADWDLPPLYLRYEVELGKMLDTKRQTGRDSLPYLRNVDVQWDCINVSDLPEMDIAPDEYDRFTVRLDDLLVCEGGEVGRTAHWRGGLARCAFQKAIHRLRPHSTSAEEPRFLFYCMRWAADMGIFVAEGNPNTIPHLTGEKFRLYRFPKPSLSAQRQIAAFLDQETAKIDALVAEQRRLMDLLKEKRQAVISHAVTKGLNPDAAMKPSGIEWLGDVPRHWKIGKCRFYVSVLSGFAFPSSGFSANESDVRLLRGTNVGVGRLRWDDTVYWERTLDDGLDGFELKAGDLVIGMDRPLISEGMRVATVEASDLPCLLLQRVASVQTGPKLISRFLMRLLSSEFFVAHFSPETTGVSVPHISPDQICNFVIPLPPTEEQERIIRYMDSETAKLDPLTAEAQRAIDLLQERRTALISAAVTGQIDVRNLV